MVVVTRRSETDLGKIPGDRFPASGSLHGGGQEKGENNTHNNNNNNHHHNIEFGGWSFSVADRLTCKRGHLRGSLYSRFSSDDTKYGSYNYFLFYFFLFFFDQTFELILHCLEIYYWTNLSLNRTPCLQSKPW